MGPCTAQQLPFYTRAPSHLRHEHAPNLLQRLPNSFLHPLANQQAALTQAPTHPANPPDQALARKVKGIAAVTLPTGSYIPRGYPPASM